MFQGFHIGLRIRELLAEKKIRHNRMADKMGISRQQFSNLLGASDWKASNVYKVAVFAGIEMAYFFPEITYEQSLTDTDPLNEPLNPYKSRREMKIEMLERDVKRLEAILEEKERLIQVLMDERK